MNIRYLRSAAISTAFSRFLALFSDVTSCGSRSRTAGATVSVPAGVIIGILHGLVLIGVLASGHGEFGGDVDFLAVQESVDDLPDGKIPRAEPAGIAAGVLRLGLQPEEVSL